MSVVGHECSLAESFSGSRGPGATADVEFELQASSDGTNTTVDTVTVTVNADNDAPSANAGANQTVDEGDVVALDAVRLELTLKDEGLTYTWVADSRARRVTLSDANAGCADAILHGS